MSNLEIGSFAAAILIAALMLIVRELRRSRASASGRARHDDLGVERARSSLSNRSDELPVLDLIEPSVEETVAGTESKALTLFEPNADVDEPTAPTDLIVLKAAAQSDCGMRRTRNEDAFLLNEQHSLFVVADGMGGYAGGEIASRLAVDSIEQVFANGEFGRIEYPPREDPVRPPRARELVLAIQAANERIHAEASENPDFRGMGTTIVAARFSRRKHQAFIAHVGDSRCYRLRDGELKLLTKDHSFAESGVTGAYAAHIHRAVGIRPRVKVDVVVDSPRIDDLYLLCSDGLNKMLGDDDTRAVLERGGRDLGAAAARLIDAVNERGGKDNVTVILIGVREARKRSSEPRERNTLGTA
jgi:protein phosphatase